MELENQKDITEVVSSLRAQARDKHRIDKDQGSIFAVDEWNLNAAVDLLENMNADKNKHVPIKQQHLKIEERMVKDIIDSLLDQAEDKDLLDNGEGGIFAEDAVNLREAASLLESHYASAKLKSKPERNYKGIGYPGFWFDCGFCGANVTRNDIYCRHCGRRLTKDEIPEEFR